MRAVSAHYEALTDLYLKRNVSVLLEDPASSAEYLLEALRTQALKIGHRRHEFVAQICLLLAQTTVNTQFWYRSQKQRCLLPQEAERLPMHPLPIVEVDKLGVFLEAEVRRHTDKSPIRAIHDVPLLPAMPPRPH